MTDYKTMPILVVDDDEADVFLVKDELEAAGVKNVHDTQRGSEALALLGLSDTSSSSQVDLDAPDTSFALVELAVMLPDIEGFEICRLSSPNSSWPRSRCCSVGHSKQALRGIRRR